MRPYSRIACDFGRTVGWTGRLPAHGVVGFTYVGLLIMMAMVSIALSVVAQTWQTMQRRDREEELLRVGHEFRHAIELYYHNTPAGVTERYPRRLEDLLRDPRYPGTRRYLRKIYRDPMTGSASWGLQKAGDLITGVYSVSDQEPFKKHEFRHADLGLEGKMKYSEWVFTPRTGHRPVPLPSAPSDVPGMPMPSRPGSLTNGISR